jgi:hypothetical protein
LILWAAIDSVQIMPRMSRVGAMRERSAPGAAAIAVWSPPVRKQLEFVYCALRDHHPAALAG